MMISAATCQIAVMPLYHRKLSIAFAASRQFRQGELTTRYGKNSAECVG
jgi:hypothetical protein